MRTSRGRGKTFRWSWLDGVLLGLIALVVLYLWRRASSEVFYRWDWSVVPEYLVYQNPETGDWRANLLVHGIYATLRLAVWGTLIALTIGVVMGCCRVSRSPFLRFVSRTYVEVTRNIPPLVIIFVFYFFISGQIMPLLGISDWVRQTDGALRTVIEVCFGPPELIENILSGLLVLAVFEAAYFTEIIRAGIQSVERGQWEAGGSIGLSRYKVMRYVVMPQAIQRTIPPLAGQLISLVKDSSMVSLISVQDLTYSGTQVAISTRKVFEIWIFVAVVYFVICFSLSLVSRWLERRMGRGLG